ncbi:hypothetical protein L596_000586 [Steinernema carpocapsae]|uniref:Uncharacterized protein n=1 Tax=Steinernema carpocapsae TaxID=34508 RepID=A0A4U8UKY5_STECR|nr:hypothetical protein L596_000586 [Steinernema carpocapsae]
METDVKSEQPERVSLNTQRRRASLQLVHMRVRICQPIRYKTTDFDSRNAYSCFTTNTRQSCDVCEKMKRRQKEIKAPSRLSKRRQGTERWI